MAELEQQLTTVTDEKTRESLSEKLDEVKQHAVKVEEKAKVEHAQPTPETSTVVKADEASQSVQPAPSTPQPQVTPLFLKRRVLQQIVSIHSL